MNRYERTFEELKKKNEIAFIPFAVAGDPSAKASEAIFKAYVDSGADILEIGFPFSDPVADGPINQRAAIRSIEAGFNYDSFFSILKKIRKYTQCPIGILMYANSAFHMGFEEFCSRSEDAGIDSLLVADMPPEESGELAKAMARHNLQSVYIVSELTPQSRMKYICDTVSGFVYVVSRLGTTGVQSDMSTSVHTTLAKLSKITEKPLCVGFGISTPVHVKKMVTAGAHGAIVGSALVKIIEDNAGNTSTMLSKLSKSVSAYKKATCNT